MTTALDSTRLTYVRDQPRISYVQPDDPWWSKRLVGSLEVLFGRNKIEEVYFRLKDAPFEVDRFFSDALLETNIQAEYCEAQLAKIPKSGPVVFLANHPYGVVDGIILCHLALRSRGDFRILIHALLCQDADLAPYFLPIDFQPTKDALRNNIGSKNQALACLKRDIPVLIFPSGMVSTADHFGFGDVTDAPWTTFAAKLVRDANASVVPIHFAGQNSRKFHVASHIAEPLRMALLVHEALNKFGERIAVSIGDPLLPEQLQQFKSRQSLTDFLYEVVQNTAAS